MLSFLEYEGTTGVVRLGAGPYGSVLSRPLSQPYVRLCCLEPPIGGVRFRSRYGQANVTANGIEDVPEPDPMVRLGAWVQLLNIYVAVARDLSLEGQSLVKSFIEGSRYHIWFACDVDPVHIRVVERNAALGRVHPVHGEVGALVVEAVGGARAMDQMFGAFRF